jgi:hypothetical protein
MSFPNAIIGWEEWTRENGLPIDVRVHPAPVYETLLYGATFLVLWRRRLTPHPDGYILWLYFLLSGASRFLVEFVRINPKIAFGLSEAQYISLASWRSASRSGGAGGDARSERGAGGASRLVAGALSSPSRCCSRRGGCTQVAARWSASRHPSSPSPT